MLHYHNLRVKAFYFLYTLVDVLLERFGVFATGCTRLTLNVNELLELKTIAFTTCGINNQ